MKRLWSPSKRARGGEKSEAFGEEKGDVAEAPPPVEFVQPPEQSRKVSFCFATAEKRPECLSREFNKMPMKDKERVTQDIYGTVTSDTLIQNDENSVSPGTIEEFWDELNEVPDKAAYEQALELSPEFAKDEFLVIAFLRSMDGSAKRAAKRYVKFWKQKLDLFGPEKLVKTITLDDFDADDMESLYSGGFQVLNANDRAGRPVLFGRYTSMKYKTVKNMLRVLWYCWMTMIENVEHQRVGIVSLGYEVSKLPIERYDDDPSAFDMNAADGGFDRDLARGALKLPYGLPIRFAGFHICADAPQWQGITDMVMVTVCKVVRHRFRVHFGSHQECKYALMTHGIPTEAIPVTLEGAIELANHKEWIADRLQIEGARRGINNNTEDEPMS